MSDLKSFAQKLSIVLGSILVLMGIFYGVSSYNEYAKEQAHIRNQATIRQMIAFCDFSLLSDEEQSQLKKCNDDVEAVRDQLKNIIQERIIYWKSKFNDADNDFEKLKGIRANAGYWDANLQSKYDQAMLNIVKRAKNAMEQREAFEKKRKELETWTPGKNDKKNLVDENPRPKKNSVSA